MPRLGRLKGKKIVWKCKFFTFIQFFFHIFKRDPHLSMERAKHCALPDLWGVTQNKKGQILMHIHTAPSKPFWFLLKIWISWRVFYVYTIRKEAVRKLLPRYFVSWTRNPDGEYPPYIWRISVTSRMRSVNFTNHIIKENNFIYLNHHGGLISNNKK